MDRATWETISLPPLTYLLQYGVTKSVVALTHVPMANHDRGVHDEMVEGVPHGLLSRDLVQ